ncbi:MAG: stage 0 sporulation protein, partial [Christensenellaceae bacterium]|nr:stage 0 sporulation protein [Christensenellaceae bacterium]
MANIIGVAFKKAGKVYSFDPGRFSVEKGQQVVVETARGLELGEVVSAAREVPDEELTQPLRGIVRLGTKQDLERIEQNKAREVEAFGVAEQRIAAHGLEMKLVSVEYTFDNSKIVFYFTADGRVDFRELVKDLASIFKMRIELRQ